MHLGPVKQLPALNSFYERIQDREPNISALKDFISRQPVDGELIVMATHFVTIGAMTGGAHGGLGFAGSGIASVMSVAIYDLALLTFG